MPRFKLLQKKKKLGPLVSTTQGTESAPSFLDQTNLSPPIQHAPQLSRLVYSSSHPSPIDQDTSHPGPTVFPESQPSPTDHLTSYPSLVGGDSSQPSPVSWDSSLPFPVSQDSSHLSPIGWNSSQPSSIGCDSSQSCPVGLNSSQPSRSVHSTSHLDSRNNVKKIKVKAKKVLNLTGEERIMIKFDVYEEPFGEACRL
ncbi:hypothetical protein T459_29609 [Capsicum annuum]|uniref:Uncharacterized protein n=1 Tax=Capsicum annuum TaxID=4072 RepID=A0A2G2Y620_CAPAN|nr:hypothetical protein T459_29609 [Capsicum annuum]